MLWAAKIKLNATVTERRVSAAISAKLPLESDWNYNRGDKILVLIEQEKQLKISLIVIYTHDDMTVV